MSTSDIAIGFKQRLRKQAEILISAVEAMPVPKTPVEVSRTASALMAAHRMIDLLFEVVRTRAKTTKAPEAPAAIDRDAVETEVLETMLADLPQLNRQQRRLAERLIRKERQSPRAAQAGR